MNIYEDITLVMVCFNSEKLIKKNLNELKKFKTIIIDNSKSNKISSFIKEFRNIRYIKNKKNIGYGLGNNLGVKECNTPFVFIVNPDILINTKSIEILYKTFFMYENAGILAPSLYDKENNRRSNGSISHIKKRKIKKKNFFNYNYAEGNTCYEYAVGCAYLIRKDFFNYIGGFDRDFFMYFEDNDLCDKTIKNNKTIIEVPEAKMVHLQGLSSETSFIQSCNLSLIHKISEYIYYKKRTTFINLYKKILINFLDYFQRFLINLILFKLKKSFKNLLRLLSIFLFLSKLYLLLY